MLGVGPRHSWRRVRWTLLVGELVGPGSVGRLWCRGSSSPILVEGAAGFADGEVGAGDGVVDADGERALQVLYRVTPRVRGV